MESNDKTPPDYLDIPWTVRKAERLPDNEEFLPLPTCRGSWTQYPPTDNKYSCVTALIHLCQKIKKIFCVKP
ncbi:MAG: hypothetical protein QX189_05330 [Methylococcales bacterium]